MTSHQGKFMTIPIRVNDEDRCQREKSESGCEARYKTKGHHFAGRQTGEGSHLIDKDGSTCLNYSKQREHQDRARTAQRDPPREETEEHKNGE
jgi:hypothetical protein